MCYFKNNLSFSGFHTERKRGHSWIWKTLGRSRQLCIVTDPQGHLIPKHNGLQSSEQIFRNIESLGKGSIFRKPPQLILGHCSSLTQLLIFMATDFLQNIIAKLWSRDQTGRRVGFSSWSPTGRVTLCAPLILPEPPSNSEGLLAPTAQRCLSLALAVRPLATGTSPRDIWERTRESAWETFKF